MKKKKTSKSKPAVPELPGRYGKMTPRELNAELAQFDNPSKAWADSKEISKKEWAAILRAGKVARGRGRPAKAPSERTVRVMLSITPHLLAATDAAARAKGLTRAGLIAEALRQRLRLKAS